MKSSERRLKKFGLLLILSLVCISQRSRAEAPVSIDPAIERYRVAVGNSTLENFYAEDGVRLSYRVFDLKATPRPERPVVISIGKGETSFRYADISSRLMERGFGPIYVLEPRGQGFSDRLVPDHELEYVRKFSDYVRDLRDFVHGPVAQDLVKRGLSARPFVVAHSMGGAIANLALLEEPDLFEAAAYIAPMIDIHVPHLRFVHDHIVLAAADFFCWIGMGDNLGFLKDRTALTSTQDPALKDERLNQIHNNGTTANWIREAVRATFRLRAKARLHQERSIIVVGSLDQAVENSATFEYACKAQNCELQMLIGPHSLHMGSVEVRQQLSETIAKFFERDSCEKLLATAQ